MNKIAKDKRDRLILVGTITAMIIALLWFLVIGDQRDSLSARAAKAQKLTESIQKAEGVVRMGPEIEKRLQEHKEALLVRESEMAPEDDPYAWMLEVMTRSCQGRPIVWQLDKPEFHPSELLPGSTYRTAVFHFKGSGFFNVIGRFIADFENSHRLFQVRSVVITPMNTVMAVRNGTMAANDDEMLAVDFYIVTPVKSADSPALAK